MGCCFSGGGCVCNQLSTRGCIEKIQKYASHTKETVVSTMILSLCFKRTCERSEEPILTGKLKVPSAKIKCKVNFLKIK